MKKPRVRRGIVIAAAAVGAFAAISISCGILSYGRFPLSESLARVTEGAADPLPAHVPDVAIVTVDRTSMQEEHPWPWPRGRFAEIVYRLDGAGAKVVAFSFDFSKRGERRNDMAFARALKDSRRVVLAAHRQTWEEGDSGEIEIVKFPAPEFMIGAAAIGHVLFNVDGDGIVRHGYRDRRIDAQAVPSLSQAAVAVALNLDPVPGDVRRFRIDYRRARPPIPTISVSDLLEGRFETADVAGRIVFVGGTAPRFHDVWATPLGSRQAGIYLQALAARTLLAEHAAATVSAALKEPS